MASYITIQQADFSTMPVPTVYTRASWADSWTQRDDMFASVVTKSAGSALAPATLIYEYGSIQQADASTYSTYAKLDILNHYVKIEWTPTSGRTNYDFAVPSVGDLPTSGVEVGQRALVINLNDVYSWDGAVWTDTGDSPTSGTETWYGVIRDETRRELGNDLVDTGRQEFTAMPMEWILTRKQITSSEVFVDDDPILVTDTLEYGLTFNEFSGSPGRKINEIGNKEVSQQLFAKSLKAAEPWSSRDIIEYLFAQHQPGDSNAPDWELSGTTAEALEWSYPIGVKAHGETLYDLLNELIDRRRGMFWYVDVDDILNRCTVVVQSTLESSLALQNGITMPANQTQWLVNIDGDPGTQSCVRSVSTQKKYSQVIVEGARLGAVATFDMDSLLEKAWSAADLTDYKTAASAPTGDKAQDRAASDARRNATPELARVFTTYYMADTWDFNDESGARAVIPEVLLDGTSNPLLTTTSWLPAVRFEDELPLLEGYDYSTDPTAPTATAVAVTRYMEPMVFIENPYGSKYIKATDLAAFGLGESGSKAGIGFNCTVRMLDDRAGVEVRPSDVPHQIGFSDTGDAFPVTNPELDTTDHYADGKWDTMRATVYVTYPQRIRLGYPTGALTTYHDSETVHLIRLGENAHLDWLVEDTVLGVNASGAYVTATAGGYIRDDRDFLIDSARLAWEWYQKDRVALNMSFAQITSSLKVGDLITEVENRGEVNSVVSAVRWNFQTFQTEYITEFGEIDIEGLLRQ